MTVDMNPRQLHVIEDLGKLQNNYYKRKKWILFSPVPEAVVQRCSVKKVFLKISPNSQENTCARA